MLRRDLMAAMRRCRRHYGLNTGDVLVLDVLLSFLPCRDRTSGQDRPITSDTMPVIFAANATICARANDMDPRVLRRHVARLAAAGFLERRDSATGKRFALRAAGRVTGAYGLDLTPLLARHAELAETAARLDREAEEMRSLRAEALTLRGALLHCTSELTAEAAAFVEEAKTILRRTTLALADVIAIRDGLQRLLGACEIMSAPCPAPDHASSEEIEATCETNEMTAGDGKTVRQVESLKVDTYTSPETDHDDPESVWTDCTALHELRRTPPRSMRDLQEFVYDLGAYLGVKQRSLADAVRALGWTGILRAMCVMVERAASIGNPNGYLASLVRNHVEKRHERPARCPRTMAGAST